MSFKDLVHENGLKNQATSNKKIQQVVSFLSSNKVGIFLRDDLFLTYVGIVNLHPFRSSHWPLYIHESYFHSYGC